MRQPRDAIFYVGQSMSPLFRAGDEVLFEPGTNRPARKGDVVIFSPPGEDRLIIHRVIQAGPEGIRTRGDRNRDPDPWLLQHGDILGWVVRLRRGGKERKIAGGPGGYLRSVAGRILPALRGRIILASDSFIRSGFYSGALASCVPKRRGPRVVAISRPEGTEFMLLMGKRVVGRRFAGNEFWQIRRRYRPFIKMQTVQKGSYAALRSGR